MSINDSEVRIVHNSETQASLLTAYFKDLFASNFTTNPRPQSLITIVHVDLTLCPTNFCSMHVLAMKQPSGLNATVEGKIHRNEIGAGTLIPL